MTETTARAAADPQQIIAELQRELNERTAERDEATSQQAATADILKVISRSTFDLQAVLDALTESAARLCKADMATITRKGQGGDFYHVTNYNFPTDWVEYARKHPFKSGRGSVLGLSLIEKRAIQVADVLTDPEYSRGEQQKRAGFRTVLAVPLQPEGKPIGVFILCRRTVSPFSDKQIELMSGFADQAVIAIENARLFNETREALERQTSTAEILKVIASSPSDVQPVFDAIAASANRLLGGFSGTVFRFIDGMAHLKAFTPTTPEADEILQSSFPQPVADFAPFQMTQAGEVMQIPDTEAPTYELKEIARARGYRSMLYVPLMSKGVSIGFTAVTRVQPGTFADHHVQLLQTFADQAVIAIENVHLFDEVQAKTRDLQESLEQQTAISDILRVISSSPGDIKPVFDTVARHAAEICEAEIVDVITVEGERLVYGAQFGNFGRMLTGEAAPLNRDTVMGRSIIDQQPIHIVDLQSLDHDFPLGREFARRFGHHTTMAIPLVRDGHALGTILVRRAEVRPFENKHIALLKMFADQAVIAIENARLLNELRERTDDLSKSLDDLRTAQDRLIQTEKLASLGQLTAGIAHEIKNPLNFVNNFSALSAELVGELDETLASAPLDQKMRGDVGELTAMLKDNLEKVVQHGKRADSIVKNMLLHSRDGSGEHRSADINALVEESLNLAYHGARAERPGFDITLARNLDPNAGAVELYPQEITRALLNLISNGFYAAAKRKSEARDNSLEPTLSTTTKNLGNKVEIRIRDNGTGIPPEVKEKMFNPFFTTKPTGEGTGLGLSISYDIIVKQHGGSIDVETEPGLFTEFKIVLPRTNQR
jgi:two-component system, NtrC family, sensor kinase